MAHDKQDSHERILESCAALLRRDGIKSASVAKVMKEAGLTVGGFYAHFDSKEAMVAEGFRHAAAQSRQWAQGTFPAEAKGRRRLSAHLKSYLSPRHRDKDLEGQGCPLAALAVDMGKGPPALRKAFAEECQKLVFEATEAYSEEGARLGRQEFLGVLSTYVGGLILARATRGSPISEEILQACLERLGITRGGQA